MAKKNFGLVRKFNHIILNPITKLFSGKTNSYLSLVYHIGRRSGKEYSTPVVAGQNKNLIYIGLPYGSDTDWVMNVSEAGKCKVKIEGKIYSTKNPVIVDPSIALPTLSSQYKASYEKAKIKPTKFLQLEKDIIS
jgi:deazaflavin-dependent oxidoreductase (nitroreductase family)